MMSRANALCRPFIARMEATCRADKEEKATKLAENLRQADLQQLVAKLENDIALLRSLKPQADQIAKDHALDMKYLQDRQRRWSGKSTKKNHLNLKKKPKHFESIVWF